MGDLSPHFDRTEFKCPHCGVVKVSFALVAALERMREAGYTHGGLVIVSGYRCPAHNAEVAGAPGSKHLRGEAADVIGKLTLEEVTALHGFTGIGWRTNHDRKLVTHVDVGIRAGATLTHPATWEYT